MEASFAAVLRRPALLPRTQRYRRSNRRVVLHGSLATLTDSEDVAVRVSDVHLAHVPRHVGWRPGYLEPIGETAPVICFDIFDRDHHPRTFVTDLISFRTEGDLRRPPPAPSLCIL